MICDKSPDGRSVVEFLARSEVGMGGPQLGELWVNRDRVDVQVAIDNWIWSADSRFIAFVQYVGRSPDTGHLRVYDIRGKRLFDFSHSVGFAPMLKSFEGGLIEFHANQAPVTVPELTDNPAKNSD